MRIFPLLSYISIFIIHCLINQIEKNLNKMKIMYGQDLKANKAACNSVYPKVGDSCSKNQSWLMVYHPSRRISDPGLL